LFLFWLWHSSFNFVFLKNALVNTGGRMLEGGGCVGSKGKITSTTMHPSDSCSLTIGVRACDWGDDEDH
jgi:hypothetical protein